MTHAALPIELKNLRWSVDNLTILHDLSLTIPAGEILALLGPSGCGKSTLLKLLAGLLQPTAGELWIGQRCVASPRHCDAPEKRNLGMVFQDYALWPHMSVAQNVAFPLRMRGMKKAAARQQADAALAQVGLEDFGDRKPALLSGGQQQRVALARALVVEPRLLLLDEPLANLDAVLREDMRVFIRELQKRVGITTLYVTHDQSEAMVMSDRVAVMLGGRLLQFDVPEAIYMRPRSVEVARFIGRSNLIEGRVEGLTDEPGPYPTYRVSTALGSVPASHDQPLATGQPVHVTIRPEAIRWRNDGPYTGLVQSAYFLGSTVEHTVQCAGGQSLLVQTSPGQRAEAGAQAAFAFDPGHAWIIAAAP